MDEIKLSESELYLYNLHRYSALNLDSASSNWKVHHLHKNRMNVSDTSDKSRRFSRNARSKKRHATSFSGKTRRKHKSVKKSSPASSSNYSATESSNPVSSEEIDQIKDSLKKHFKAIRSLQEALSYEFHEPKEKISINNKEKRHLKQLLNAKELKILSQIHPLSGEIDQVNIQKEDLLEEFDALRQDDIKLKMDKIESQLMELKKQLEEPRISGKTDGAKQKIELLKNDTNRQINDCNMKTATLEAQIDSLKQELSNISQAAHNSQLEFQAEVNTLRRKLEDQDKLNQRLQQANESMSHQIHALTTFFDKPGSKGVSQFEKRVRELTKNTIADPINHIRDNISAKVDTTVLEELVRHMITKDELKKHLKKSSLETLVDKKLPELVSKTKLNSQETFEKFILTKFKELESSIDDKFEHFCVKDYEDTLSPAKIIEIESKIQKGVQNWATLYVRRQLEGTWTEIKEEVAELLASQNESIKLEIQKEKNSIDPAGNLNECDLNPLVRQLTRDFDEKLYVLCSELSSCKTLLSAQVSQPFYRCAQWLWNSGKLKMGSAVPWNIESTNTGN
jgi:hypothetical protein